VSLAAAAAVLAVGVAAGLLSGLVGIGGGVLIVPFLYFLYAHPDWFGVLVPPELAAVVAHATSLFVIVPTSIRGALAFHRAGLVVWRAAVPIGIAAAVAAIAGSRLAVLLPPELLKLVFGALLVVSATRLAWHAAPRQGAPEKEPLRLATAPLLATGAAVGLLSGAMGVGGGVIAIPLLLHVVRIEVRRVAATSLAVIIFAALAGTVAYMFGGLGVAGLPRWSVGYVHLAAGIGIAVGAVIAVPWGAALNRRLPERTLALVFAAVFALIGVRLVIDNAGALLGAS
jgi:uncharacterized membrane protein YfcA